jgi:glycosyltransferase involved in cell wall biosynthesis
LAKPTVTYVLMCYRHAPYVERAVRSALKQQYEPLDILISDDASDDQTFAIIESTVARYVGPHRVRLNRNDANLGMAHFNRILELCESDYIVVAHGDDYSHTERTETLMQIFEREGVSMVSSNCQVMNRRGERLGTIATAKSQRITIDSIVRNGWQPTMLGATHAIHRDVLERFGGVDPNWLPASYDMAFPFRGALLKGSYFTDAELVAWRRHGGNMTDRLIRTAGSPAEQAEGFGASYMIEMMGMFNDLRTLQRAEPGRRDLERIRGQLMQTAMTVLYEWMGVRNKLMARGMYPTWTPLSALPELSDDAAYDGRGLNWLFRRLLGKPGGPDAA